VSRATPVSTILEQVHNQFGLRLKARDIYNLRAEQRRIDLVDTTAIQWLVETLGERDFFVAIDTAEDNPDRVTRLFFAHPESIKLLAKYPDSYGLHLQNQPIQHAPSQFLWCCRQQYDSANMSCFFERRERGRLYLGIELLQGTNPICE
jgi:hypothetical protein